MQRQEFGSRVGTGYSVQEVYAPAADVWRVISAFDRYNELIPTVRTAQRYAPAGGGTCYRFLVRAHRSLLPTAESYHCSLSPAPAPAPAPSFLARWFCREKLNRLPRPLPSAR